MKRVIVTPAGRERYMSLLAAYLLKQKSSFDEWHIWENTTNPDDIKFFKKLNAKIINHPESDPSLKNINLNKFYAIDSYEPDTLYLKLDDDIVWMEPNFIDKMFTAREENKFNLLIFANTVNNSTCTHLHMRYGILPWDPMLGYNTFDPVCWANPLYAERIHRTFLANVHRYEKFYHNDWYFFISERCSINAVSWRGEDFALFNGTIEGDDEQFLTYHAPSLTLNKHNMIYGQCLCSHFSYKTQQGYLNSTDILSGYQKLLNFSV